MLRRKSGLKVRHPLHFSEAYQISFGDGSSMGELSEKRWAVISERGCEASGMVYAEAAALMRKLDEEKVYGLCIVAEEVARHLPPVRAAVSTTSRPTETRHTPT